MSMFKIKKKLYKSIVKKINLIQKQKQKRVTVQKHFVLQHISGKVLKN